MMVKQLKTIYFILRNKILKLKTYSWALKNPNWFCLCT